MVQGNQNKGVRLATGLLLSVAVSASPMVWAESHAESRNVQMVYQESQQFARSKKVAVLVGVGNYTRQSHLKRLRFPATDARMIEKVLKNRHNYTTRVLVDAEGNKDHILDAIRQAGELLPDNGQGTLVFFFSGHGFARNGQNYLATSNITPGRLQQSALTINEVEAAIKQTRARRAIILVDACRDDPWVDGAKSYAPSKFLEQQSEGVQHLFGAKFGEQSWEHPDLGNGVFSHFLYKGLNGEAVERDGIISFDSLKLFVQDKVSDWTFRKLQTTQKPYHEGKAFGVFVLGQVEKHVQPYVSHQSSRQPRPTPIAQATPRTVTPQPVRQPQPQRTPIAQATPRTVTPQPVRQPQPQPPRRPHKQWFEPDMVSIPEGTFIMGCDPARDEVLGGCADDEKPSRRVRVSAFKMAKMETTFEQWDVCSAEGVCVRADDEGWGRGKRPVINVSWNDSQTYIKWLNQKTGKKYQLPTEAQWEYAARANSDTAFAWGTGINCYVANYGSFNYKCNTHSTKTVGHYPKNNFGLFDTAGNVREWVLDCWKSSYQGSSGIGQVQQDCSGSSGRRISRGGAWYDDGRVTRPAFRMRDIASYRNYGLGFRLSLDES